MNAYARRRCSTIARELGVDVDVLCYTHTLWQEFVDLAAYTEDPTDLGADASDMEQCARVCLYLIAERLARALASELDDVDDDA